MCNQFEFVSTSLHLCPCHLCDTPTPLPSSVSRLALFAAEHSPTCLLFIGPFCAWRCWPPCGPLVAHDAGLPMTPWWQCFCTCEPTRCRCCKGHLAYSPYFILRAPTLYTSATLQTQKFPRESHHTMGRHLACQQIPSGVPSLGPHKGNRSARKERRHPGSTRARGALACS